MTQRPRIIWITHLPPPYRIPVWRHIQRRFDMQIQCTEGEESIGRLGSENRGEDWGRSRYDDLNIITLKVLRLRLRGEPLWLVLPTRRAWTMRSAQIAVLFGGWESPSYWWLMLRAKVLRRPVVCFYESPANTHRFSGGLVPRLRAWVFKNFDAVVVPGVAARKSVENMGVAASRIFEGFNAVDVQAFAEGAAAARIEGGSRSTGHRYVFVGQLVARKRVEELLAAFALTTDADDTLTFFGTGDLGPRLRMEAERHGIAERVLFEGYVENSAMPNRLPDYDTLCLVSDEEVWGLVVNEALAAGLQVVVSSNCGVAPSVADMDGVIEVRPDLLDLQNALLLAKQRSAGPILNPAILQHTPENLAATFVEAFDYVLRHEQRA